MRGKRITGIVLLIVGIITYLLSDYIAQEVALGKEKIANAQKQVDTGNSLFSQSPYTEDAGKILTDRAQGKIDAGQAEVDKYEKISKTLHVGGIILAIVGAGFLIVSFRSKKR